MKNLILFLLLGVITISSTFAQDNMDNNPKVMQKRKEFYNKELQFTPAEQKAFWPIFEKYQKEEDQLRRKYRPNAKLELMNDDEAEAQIKRSFEYDQKKNELKQKYFDQFSEVLPVRKVALIGPTERKFKKLILKQIKARRG
jgi:hypothetical protein